MKGVGDVADILASWEDASFLRLNKKWDYMYLKMYHSFVFIF
jgi:hypothetical protein